MKALAVGKITGPHHYENIDVFFFHGAGAGVGIDFVPLDEALEKDQLVVEETGNVNNLVVRNTTADQHVFIETGEIVRGGKQDRMMPFDLFVAPGATVDVTAFCVESGRWRSRGSEDASTFTRSGSSVASSEVRRAATHTLNQGAVWEGIREMQTRWTKTLGKNVQSSVSPSSFLLAMENEDLVKDAKEYTRALEKKAMEYDDIIGFGIAINGRPVSADVYAERALFMKKWKKNLRTAVLEAIGKRSDAPKQPPESSREDFETWYGQARDGKPEKEDTRKLSDTTLFQRLEIPSSVAARTYFKLPDADDKDSVCVHENVLAMV